MLDARQQSVSGPQTRLTHCYGQSLPKGSGPLHAGLHVLRHSRSCVLGPTGFCSGRVRCFVLEGYPPTTRGYYMVLVIFGGQCQQGGWYSTYSG